MASEVGNLEEFMFRGWLDLQVEGWEGGGGIFPGNCSIIEPLKS